MIKVTINNEDFKVCDSWSDVTFGQYINILIIQKDAGWSDLERSIKIISALSDRPKELEEYMFQMDVDDFEGFTEIMDWVKKDFEEESKNQPEIDSIEIDGRTFVIKKNYNKLTLGEIVTLETMLKDGNYDYQEIALAILLREVVNGEEKKFNEEDFYEILNTLKDKINLLSVYKYITFFLTGVKTSTKNNIKGFSVQKI